MVTFLAPRLSAVARLFACIPLRASLLQPGLPPARCFPLGRCLFFHASPPQLASPCALLEPDPEVVDSVVYSEENAMPSEGVSVEGKENGERTDMDGVGTGGGANEGAEDDVLEIANLGISDEIVGRLAKNGITKLFPIQRAVFEPAMQGRDVIGRAKTGTGKTLAFGIPIMDKVSRHIERHGRGKYPLALVLAPTRELARQLDKEFRDNSSLDTLCVYGGVANFHQKHALESGVDIVTGTPGRLIDLLLDGVLNLSEVQFFVIDEADQLLNFGFVKKVEHIMERLPQNHQTMMFSFTTMPLWTERITKMYLNNPLIIDLVGDTNQKLPEGISVYSILTDDDGKPFIIGPLITEHAEDGKCIIFSESILDAQRLAYALGSSYECKILHQDIPQEERELTISGFRSGRFNILIATDLASRGLDIPNVDLVVHYGIPGTSELFVHRSGRTGRAGKAGKVILIYTDDQSSAVKFIQRDVGCKFIELPKIVVDCKDREMHGQLPGDDLDSSPGFGYHRRSSYSGRGSRDFGHHRRPNHSGHGGIDQRGGIDQPQKSLRSAGYDRFGPYHGDNCRSDRGPGNAVQPANVLRALSQFAAGSGRSDSLFGFLKGYCSNDDRLSDCDLPSNRNKSSSCRQGGLRNVNSGAVVRSGGSVFENSGTDGLSRPAHVNQLAGPSRPHDGYGDHAAPSESSVWGFGGHFDGSTGGFDRSNAETGEIWDSRQHFKRFR